MAPISRLEPKRQSRWTAISAAIGVLGLLSPPAFLIARRQHHAWRLEQRASVLDQLTPVANSLADAVNRRLALNRALRVFVQARWNRPNQVEDFEIFASGLRAGARGIRALELMPRGICQFVYPLAGNERMLGHDMFSDQRPEVRDDLRRALKSRETIVNGPLLLRQGGLGLLAREAVDLDGRFWGFVTTVLDVPPILDEAGVTALSSRLQIALRDTHGKVFFGSGATFAAPSDPVVLPVQLPEGRWELAALPPALSLQARWGLIVFDSVLGASVLLVVLAAYGVAERYRRMRSRMESDRHSYLFVAEELPGLVAAFDSARRYTFANRAHEEWFGREPESLIGQRATDVMPPELSAKLDEVERSSAGEPRVSFQSTIRHPGKGLRRLAITLAQDRGQAGGSHMLAVDVTEERLTEERLQQAQRLESLGRLAGGVAHDFNNLLTVINGYAELLLAAMDPEDRMREPLSQVQAAGRRAADLTQQLLAFGRKQVVEPRAVDLGRVVASGLTLLRRLVREDIDLRLHGADGSIMAFADPTQVHRVLMNLVVNARDAISGCGWIDVEVLQQHREDASADVATVQGAQDWAVLQVSDSGSGMSEEVQQRLFEPFFTTKGAGAGTGLGLATCYGVVRQMGGWIEVQSTVGAGATFKVFLPLAGGAPPATADVLEVTPYIETETQVLVVEDQEEVRQLIVAMVRRLGYRTLEACDGPSALALLQASQDPVHLLLTDVLMPAMTGKELAERVLELSPATRIVYMSGYASDVLHDRGFAGEDFAYLAKPFDIKQLQSKLREILGKGGG